MGVLVKLIVAVLEPVAKALIPFIIKELKTHQTADMVGGGDSTRDTVNDDTADQIRGGSS